MNIPLNIDWQQILLHFFNFSILVGGLYLLLFKPVKRFMEKREKHYADMEAAAVAREKDTEALKAAMAQREADFDAVLEEKRAAAAKEAEAFAQLIAFAGFAATPSSSATRPRRRRTRSCPMPRTPPRASARRSWPRPTARRWLLPRTPWRS